MQIPATQINAVSLPTDGWTADTATWSYASATTFTVAGVDVTAKFSKGTRIKLTQSATVKYFVVTDSAFGTDTTVTITGGSDYTFTNNAVTLNYFSYAANPQGYPGWFAYDCAPQGFSGTPTQLISRFSVVGSTCTVTAYITGTSNVATFTLSLPIASKDVDVIICYIQDNGAGVSPPGRGITSAASTTITMGKTASANGGFTTSLAKGCNFTLPYEIN